jgi:predicted phage tail protein
MKLLQGAGGGSSTPVSTEDNLLSDDYLEVVLGIAEGPIRGLVGKTEEVMAQSIYVGETPLVNQNGSLNFTNTEPDNTTSNSPGFVWAMYKGTPSDTAIKYTLGGSSSNQSVGTPLGADPVTRQTNMTQRGFTLIQVRLHIDQLAKQTSEGTFEHTAHFKIEYKPTSANSWINWDQSNGDGDTTITGKTTSGYVKEFSIHVPALLTEDYNVRVTKLSPINTTELFVSMTWESMQLVVPGDGSYPNTALLHMKGKATNQFSSVPDFSGIYEGWVMSVPMNYNPTTRVYNESTAWNGTFQQLYTNNPAWVLYNLITDTRLGLARYYPGVVANRYAFYRAAKWCDTLVPDGIGGMQPRFTFNELITQQRNGLEMLQYIAGSFNASLFDDENGAVHLRTDEFSLPLQIFTPENTTADGFQYSYSDITTRVNSITVSFVNPDLNWAEDRRIYEYQEGIDANGRIPFDFVALGCTNVQEAVRRAKYRAVTANTEVTSVNFTTNRLGMLTSIFDTIYIADPDSGWTAPGRIKSIVGNVVNLRDAIFFTSPGTAMMEIVTASGIHRVDVNPPGTGLQSYVTRTGGYSFPGDMPPNCVFTLSKDGTFGYLKPFRVLSITEADDGGRAYQISAVEVNTVKYSGVEGGTSTVSPPYSYITPQFPDAPFNLRAKTLTRVSAGGAIQTYLEVTWEIRERPFTVRFDVAWQENLTGHWDVLPATGNSIIIGPILDGRYYNIAVTAISPTGTRSRAVVLNWHWGGVVLDKSPIATCKATGQLFSVKVSWVFVDPPPVGVKEVEVWGSTTNNRWDALKVAAIVFPGLEFVQTGLVPGVMGYYWIRAKMADGGYSPWKPLSESEGMSAAAILDGASIVPLLPPITIDQFGPDLLSSFLGLETLAATMALAEMHEAYRHSSASASLSAEALVLGTGIYHQDTILKEANLALASTVDSWVAVLFGNTSMIQQSMVAQVTKKASMAEWLTELDTAFYDPVTGVGSKASIVNMNTAIATALSATASTESSLFASFGSGEKARVFRGDTAPSQILKYTSVQLSNGTRVYSDYISTGDLWFKTGTTAQDVYIWTGTWTPTKVGGTQAWNEIYDLVVADTTSSLALRFSNLSARFGDLPTGKTVTAFLTDSYYTKANTDSAITSRLTQYNSSLFNADGSIASQALVSEFTKTVARSTSVSAVTERALFASLGSTATHVFRQTIPPTDSDVTIILSDGTYATHKFLTNGDIWYDISGIEKIYVWNGAWVLTTHDTSSAWAQDYTTVFNTPGSTVAAHYNALAARFVGIEDSSTVKTWVEGYTYSMANADSAISSAINTLSATVSGKLDAKVSTTTLDTVRADWTSTLARSEKTTYAVFGGTPFNRVFRGPTAPTQRDIVSTLTDGTTYTLKYLNPGDLFFNTGTIPESTWVWGTTSWIATGVNSASAWQQNWSNTFGSSTSAFSQSFSDMGARFTGIGSGQTVVGYLQANYIALADKSGILTQARTDTVAYLTAPGTGALALAQAAITNIQTSRIGYATDTSGAVTDDTTLEAAQAAGHAWHVGLPLATAVQNVKISDGTGYATLQQRFTAQKGLNDTLSLTHSVLLDNNGYVTGTTSVNGGPGASGFTVITDTFRVARPGLTPLNIFTIGAGANGANTVGINGNLLLTGSVTADSINGLNLRVYGGGFASDGGWSGTGGYYLSSGALRMGKFPGGFFEVLANGDMTAPGFMTRSGVLTISALNVIGSSNIETGGVDTGNLAANSSTYAVGNGGYGSIVGGSITLKAAGRIMVTVMANALAYNATESTLTIYATCGGVAGPSVGVSLNSGYSGSATAIGFFNVAAGTYAVGGSVSASNRNIGATAMHAVGVMR